MERAYQQKWFLSFTLFLVFHFKFLMPLGFTSSRSLSCESKPIGSAIPNEITINLLFWNYSVHGLSCINILHCVSFQHYFNVISTNNLHAVIICVFRVRRHFSASSCVSHTVIICSVITWLSIL